MATKIDCVKLYAPPFDAYMITSGHLYLIKNQQSDQTNMNI